MSKPSRSWSDDLLPLPHSLAREQTEPEPPQGIGARCSSATPGGQVGLTDHAEHSRCAGAIALATALGEARQQVGGLKRGRLRPPPFTSGPPVPPPAPRRQGTYRR